jgi:hypothetical protein
MCVARPENPLAPASPAVAAREERDQVIGDGDPGKTTPSASL